jgi:hypothetical protein
VVAAALNFRDTGEMRSGFTTQLFNDGGVHGFTPGKRSASLRTNRAKAEALDSKGYTRFATAMREFAEQYDRQAERTRPWQSVRRKVPEAMLRFIERQLMTSDEGYDYAH